MNIIFHQQKAGLFGEIEKYKKLEKKTQEGPGFCFVKNQENMQRLTRAQSKRT